MEPKHRVGDPVDDATTEPEPNIVITDDLGDDPEPPRKKGRSS